MIDVLMVANYEFDTDDVADVVVGMVVLWVLKQLMLVLFGHVHCQVVGLSQLVGTGPCTWTLFTAWLLN